MKKVLLTATVQSHICQFHKPLVEMLHFYGYEVHVAARNNLAEKNGLKLDFVDRVFDIPFSRSPKSKDNLMAYKQLRILLNNESYDVIHCNTPMGGIVTRLSAMNARKNGTKLFYTAHGFHFYKGAPIKNWIIFYPVEKIFSRFTDLIITITREDYKLAKSKFHCDVAYIHGVGVNEQKFCDDIFDKSHLRIEYGFSNDDFILLTVGELNDNKNQILILQALNELRKEIPRIKYILAGNGPKLSELKKYVKENELEDIVVFLGYTTKVPIYLHLTDVLISASKREGLPLNVMEAMLSKTPVIASKNRGHNELIDDLKTGLLFDSDNVNELKECILKIYRDLELKNNITSNAYVSVQIFSSKSVFKELASIYDMYLSLKK